jgi:DNA-binding NarL/FixJ family response regulator
MYLKNSLRQFATILMLDSEEKLLEVTKNYFFIKNIQIITTSYLDVALCSLEKTLPDCIVVDIAMPNNVGIKFIHELKKNKEYEYVPFILLTTRGLTEDRIRGYDLGCSAYISKPFDPEELEAIVKNIILKSEMFYEFMLSLYILIKDTRLNLLNNCKDLRLTRQEQFIFREILIGKSSAELSLNLNISLRCVEKYIARILNKTNTKSIKELKMISPIFL